MRWATLFIFWCSFSLFHFIWNSCCWRLITLSHPKVKVSISQLCPTLCNPMDCSLPGSTVHGILGCHFHLQGMFWTQGLNQGLLLCRQILHHLSHQEMMTGKGPFPEAGSSVDKESTCSAGDSSLIPGFRRFPGEGICYPLQYSWASLVAQLVRNLPAMWETWVWSLGWEDLLEKGKATHSNILAWRIPWTV